MGRGPRRWATRPAGTTSSWSPAACPKSKGGSSTTPFSPSTSAATWRPGTVRPISTRPRSSARCSRPAIASPRSTTRCSAASDWSPGSRATFPRWRVRWPCAGHGSCWRRRPPRWNARRRGTSCSRRGPWPTTSGGSKRTRRDLTALDPARSKPDHRAHRHGGCRGEHRGPRRTRHRRALGASDRPPTGPPT